MIQDTLVLLVLNVRADTLTPLMHHPHVFWYSF